MFSSKVVISALALASSAHAASCSTKSTMTIDSAAQVTDLSSCQTFSGSVAFSTKLPGDITISGLKEITGNFDSSSGKMSSLEATDLNKIGGTWTMISPSNLGSLMMPALSAVKGINWANWPPNLLELQFTTGITDIDSISITTTQLSSLDGINPKSVADLKINQNPLLQNVTMQITSVTSQLQLTGNSEQLGTDTAVKVSFPKLKQMDNGQFSQIGSIDLPALAKTTGLLAINSGYMTDISLPVLATTGGISIANNTMLKTLSIPKVFNDTGSFTIADNEKLTGTLSFPSLEYIKGAPVIEGTFSGLSIPKLKQVRGRMTIKSTKKINTVCNHFEGLGGAVTQAKVTCSGGQNHVSKPPPKTGNHGGNGNNGGSNGNNSGKSAASNIHVSAGLVLGGTAAIVALLL